MSPEESVLNDVWPGLKVRFAPDLYANLRSEADRVGTPMAVIVREAVARDLRRRARERNQGGS